jgi:hypothetical protein
VASCFAADRQEATLLVLHPLHRLLPLAGTFPPARRYLTRVTLACGRCPVQAARRGMLMHLAIAVITYTALVKVAPAGGQRPRRERPMNEAAAMRVHQ